MRLSTGRLFTAVLFMVIILCTSTVTLADDPPDNAIPFIAVHLNWWKFSPELLCEMSWKYFDGYELNLFLAG